MYDSYSYQIYRWLIDNGITDNIDDVIFAINVVIDSVDSVGPDLRSIVLSILEESNICMIPIHTKSIVG